MLAWQDLCWGRHYHILNIHAVGLIVSEKKIFIVFPIITL